MTNLFYEDAGNLKVAHIVQKTESTYQADTQHGKRVKIKSANVFLEFEGDMVDFLLNAQTAADDIDTKLLWECVGEAEFSAEHAAREYFGQSFSKTELAAVYIALYAAPMYFHKKNKGIFKAASAEILKQAIAAIERKAQQEAQIQSWADELASGSLPDHIAAELPYILHAPDKQSPAFKAFTKACHQLDMSAQELAKYVGGITSVPQYLLQRFEIKYFPNGTGFPELPPPQLPDHLDADYDMTVFSIDNASTTEVDDAFSVQDLGGGVKRVGIHIAAPALAVEADSAVEKLILKRLSTVYFPGNKITMLPENWISVFSLDEGNIVPAFSIYFDVDAEWNVSEPVSKIELIKIATNLRIEQIEPFFNSETGTGNAEQPQFKHHADCIYLLDLAYELQKKRDRFEDPATAVKKYDYGIDFDAEGKVVITRRERGSPIDTLVSEMMILANSSWAKVLDDHELGGLFRVQPALRERVRTSTYAERHMGMNLAHYGWFTSPLRRASDYINQKQLQSVIEQRNPRFARGNTDLFVAMNHFDTAYVAYRAFQDMMENYWAMVWLQQENIKEINAMLIKDDLVRLDGVPLTARVMGIPMEIAPKSMLKLEITEINTEERLISLKYLSVLPNAAPADMLDLEESSEIITDNNPPETAPEG